MRSSRWLALPLALLTLTLASGVRAEGSAEFDAFDVSGTHDTADQALTQDTVLRLDILDGTAEQICWRGTGSLVVSQPNGTTSVGTVTNNNCIGAVNGVSGAYLIDMQADQVIGTAWSIRVCPKSVANAAACFASALPAQPRGRLWALTWNFQENTSFAEARSINGSVFAIVPGGAVGRDAVIEMQMRGVSGARYRLTANGIGPEDSTAPFARVGRSIAVANHRVTPSLPLYLNLPATALYNWLSPVVSNVLLAPACGSGIVQDRAPGAINFTSNVVGQYVVICDVNKDSVYDFASSGDFSSFGTANVGANTTSWNGKNNANANAAEGTYSCVVRLNVGEFHYVAEDIETSYPGIRMFRIEPDKSTRTGIPMFWDDSGVGADAETMGNGALSPAAPLPVGLDPGAYAATPLPFFFSGMPSVAQGNARAWGNFDADGKGNDNFLDQFAAAETAQSSPIMVSVVAAASDGDSDGLTTTRECDLGSNPEDNDSDNDGVLDGVEASNVNAPNTDGDGPIDILDPDSDNDGVSDGVDVNRLNPTVCRDMDVDNCDDCALTGANASGGSTINDGTDTNNDGQCNVGDPDDDGDGVPDGQDSAPLNPNSCRDTDVDGCDDCAMSGANGSGGVPTADGTDSDGDGLCNDGSNGSPTDGDPDDDNDGVNDAADAAPADPLRCRDTDLDGCDDCALTGADHSGGNPANDGSDPDGDGQCGANAADNDGDGVPDASDLDLDNDGIPNTLDGSGDADTDGVANQLDLDSDFDGLFDVAEAGGGNLDANSDGRIDTLVDVSPRDGLHDPLQTANGALPRPDTDGDGQPDFLDTDDDGDGLLTEDELDDIDGEGKPIYLDGKPRDTDGDGKPDHLDADDDGDGIPTRDERDTNGRPRDTDGDGKPDHLDADDDGDGIPSRDELDANGKPVDTDGDGKPDHLDADDDGDGIPSRDELDANGKPVDTDGDGKPDHLDADGDDDGDGVPTVDELDAGQSRDTDHDGKPDHLDTDDDGDGVPTSDELAGGKPQDTDGDGKPNHLDTDDDDDGVLTADELDDEGQPQDTDDDGKLDHLDTDDDDDRLLTADELDDDGQPRDTDSDGKPDHLDTDDDGDGIPTADELDADGQPRDTDHDGKPDHLDADDDGDGVATRDERTDGTVDRDTDDDGKPDHLDVDDDGDGIPTKQEPRDADDNGVPDRLEPTTGTLAGGALCSVQKPGASDRASSAWSWIGAFWLLVALRRMRTRMSRARRVLRSRLGRSAALAVLGWLIAPNTLGSAQVALDQFRPAPLATDGFAISRPTVLAHGSIGAVLIADYANDPLVYELRPRDPDSEQVVVGHHFVLHAGLALGLWDRLALFMMLPVHVLMSGDDNLTVRAPPADGAGLGDVALGGRVRLAGNDDSLAALAVELVARLPTADLADRSQTYRGDAIGSYEPGLILELHAGRFDVRVRAGGRFREQVQVGNLELGQEVSYGLGARLRVAKPLVLHAEAYGSTYVDHAFDREHSPAEALFGAKFESSGWHVGAAAGPGLLRGYGSPDVRLVAMLGYAKPKESPVVAQVDTDHDGLFDADDRCPLVPEDRDRFEDADGCPDPDNDRDEILDVSDRCPNKPEDRDQFEDEDGCPDPDNDQDGVLDAQDHCPIEAEDRDQFEDEDGCPDPDNDRDHVLDGNDRCPNEPEDLDGWEDADGCPEAGTGLVKLTCEKIEIQESVYFETAADVIQSRSFALLDQVVGVLQQATQVKRMRVEGHSDDRGKDAYNLKLSQRRAAAVLRYLLDHGVSAERIASEGYGETRPIDDNKTEAGRTRNRRVEFVVLESEGCP